MRIVIKIKLVLVLLLIASSCSSSRLEPVYHVYLSDNLNKNVDIYLADRDDDEIIKLVVSYSIGILNIQEIEGMTHEQAYQSMLDIYEEYQQFKNLEGVLYMTEPNAFESYPKEQRENNPIKVTIFAPFFDKEYDNRYIYSISITIVIDYSKDNNSKSLQIIYDKLGISESDFDEKGMLLHSKLKDDKMFILHDAFLGETHVYPLPIDGE